MNAFHLTAIDLNVKRRVSLGFFESDRLAAEVRMSYRNSDSTYRDYRIEPCVVEGEGIEPVLCDPDR